MGCTDHGPAPTQQHDGHEDMFVGGRWECPGRRDHDHAAGGGAATSDKETVVAILNAQIAERIANRDQLLGEIFDELPVDTVLAHADGTISYEFAAGYYWRSPLGHMIRTETMRRWFIRGEVVQVATPVREHMHQEWVDDQWQAVAFLTREEALAVLEGPLSTNERVVDPSGNIMLR